MGLFWDLIQQSQISNQRTETESLDARVVALENELRRTQQVLNALVVRLEQHFGEDINKDGRIG
jgi:chaperonin cofactor prefoldin